ncbi:MAG: hypothetical protein IJD48_00535 [Clostridia bacterium]|nr:hypothetical protein [Clostridia bacterium]
MKKPEFMMLIRVLPFVAYNICILFIEVNFWLFIVWIAFFYAFSISIKNCCHDSVLIYAMRATRNRKDLAINRTINYFSTIISTMLGGIFIGLNMTVVILISSALYTISVVPLYIFYLKRRRKTSLHKDYTTNAEITFNKHNVQVDRYKNLTKDIIIMNFVLTILYGATNYIMTLYNLSLFVSSSSFVIAGYISAIVNFAKIAATFMGLKLSQKYDGAHIAIFSCVILALTVPLFIFITQVWVACVFLSIYCFSSELLGYVNFLNLNNSKLIGKSSEANMYGRQMGAIVGQVFTTLPVVITGSFIGSFLCASTILLFGCFYWPIKDRKVKKQLVNYLHNNEIET